jgi:hypothetical protein
MEGLSFFEKYANIISPSILHMFSDRDYTKVYLVRIEDMHNFLVGKFIILRRLECITYVL